MDLLMSMGAAAAMLVAAKTMAWVIQRRLGNAGIVDAVWAWALGGLALWFAWVGPAPAPLRILLATLGGLWGLRLGVHLWRRNWRTAEDWRYAQLRQEWAPHAQSRLFWFFQFQNLFTLALAGSAFVPAAWRTDLPSPGALALAVVIALVAVGGETLADAQLATFKRQGHHGTCDRGLWRYSRHPNYFFECLHWLAYVPLAWGGPLGLWSLLAPLVMLGLILKLSGVPLLERELAQRVPGYRDYQARTSMLLPWPPRPTPPSTPPAAS